MPAQSKSQQRFFGVVKAMQKGDIPKKGKAGKIAKTMSKDDVDDFASTKHKGKPEKVKREQRVRSLIKKMVREELNKMNEVKDSYVVWSPLLNKVYDGPVSEKEALKLIKKYAKQGQYHVGMLGTKYFNKTKLGKKNPVKEGKLNEFNKAHFLNLIKQEIESLKGQIAYAKDKVRYRGTPDWEKKEFAAILKDKIKDLKDTEKHYKRVEKLKEGKLTEGKGVDKVLSMANNNSFGKLGGKTVDAMSANLFKTVYDKLTGSNKEKIDKMNEKQLYVFMTKLWTKFGKQVRI